MISDEVLFEEPKIELIGVTEGTIYDDNSIWHIGPDEFSVYGARGCFEEKSTFQLLKEDLQKEREEIEKKEEAVLRESSGRGHGSITDQNYFILSIENLTRAATLQLCLPEYLAHLQQSLRRAKADRGFFVPESIRESALFKDTKEVLYNSFNLYEEMQVSNIPGEDARYPLSLLTKTNIQTGGNAREFTHLDGMNEQGEVPSYVREVTGGIIAKASEVAPKLFKRRDTNYETLAWYPSAQLYSSSNHVINKLIEKYGSPNNVNKVILISHSGVDEIDEESIERAIKEKNETDLANLKHIHFEFLLPMSIACYHQSTRQRTWNHSIESIYDSAKRGEIIIPPTIASSQYEERYREQNETMLEFYIELIGNGVERKEAIGIIPHATKMYDWVHVNGWNALHSIGKRTCKEAQWEIRYLAKQMANYIKQVNPTLGKWAEPQCITYKRCPEKKPCGYEKLIDKFWN